MTKYLLNRLLRGFLSIIAVVAIIMILVYAALDRELIFAYDSNYNKQKTNNDKTVYRLQRWEEYGYLDYVPYVDWLSAEVSAGNMTKDEALTAQYFADLPKDDSEAVKTYIERFTDYYESKGYTVERLNGGRIKGSKQFYAYKDIPLFTRLWNYFTHVITIDNIHFAKDMEDSERGISFTLFDPVYGGKVFSPAIIGNGTQHKYLLYFDNKFPFIHQNLININLGTSYSITRGVDVWNTMNDSQGGQIKSMLVYPTGYSEMSADDLHTATYIENSLASDFNRMRFTDNYTSTSLVKDGFSKVGYSFLIGIISVILAYLMGVPLGIFMARHKDGVVDKIGTIYIIFIIAVPSLAYIFMFRAIGGGLGLPTTFDTTNLKTTMYILPIISLALPSMANLMKWLRRFMIDQSNADYVKFVRSEGLSENEIFSKHILKNAIIPIVHGVPGSILGALVGAIITERIYVVPGTGNLLTKAINLYDNGVIVGVAMFYAVLSVISIILGDILMAMIDPRISFSSKGR